MDPHLGEMIGSIEPARPIEKRLVLSDEGRVWRRYGWLVFLVAGCLIAAVCAVLIGFLVWAVITLMIAPAHAHDAAEWIQRGNYKNAVGELCCGEQDCVELDDAAVKVTPSGYRVTLPTAQRGAGYIEGVHYEIVPFSEATPSPDGKYWRCQWGGARKCFFAPPGSS